MEWGIGQVRMAIQANIAGQTNWLNKVGGKAFALGQVLGDLGIVHGVFIGKAVELPCHEYQVEKYQNQSYEDISSNLGSSLLPPWVCSHCWCSCSPTAIDDRGWLL